MTQRILIGFAEAVAAIEVAFSLHKANYEISLFFRETSLTALATGLFARTCHPIIAPEDDVEASLTELARLWQSLGQPSVFPLDDASLWLVQGLAARHPKVVVIGARGPQAELALDKRKQLDVARAAGFSVPKTGPGEKARGGDFPRFIKGRLAAEVRDGRLVRTGGRRVADEQDICDFLGTAIGSETLSQPYLEGVGEGVFGLAREGQLLIASGHRRIRMMNPKGSGASACEPRTLSHDEEARTRCFLEICRWNGLFMLELLKDSSGTSWFMELNGRPWGSMALARKQCLDYPRWAADLALSNLPPTHLPQVIAATKIGVESRHLGREIIHLAYLTRQYFRERNRISVLFYSLREMIKPEREVDYYNLAPAGWSIFFRDVLFTLARHNQGTRLGRLLMLPNRIIRCWHLLLMQADTPELRLSLREKLLEARTIAVVCYGNINRSAIAAVALAQALPPSVQVQSFGLHRRRNRPADPVMIEIAEAFEIDLSEHRSRIFTSVTAEESDLILVMERWHCAWMNERYPQARGKVFLMGLLDDGSAEIRDPFKKSAEVYASVAKRIVALTNGVRQRTLTTGEALGKLR